MTSPHVWLLAAIPLLLLVVYRRARRLVGRQLVRPKRLWLRVGLVTLILASLAGPVLGAGPQLAEALSGGLLVGLALGVFGVRLTHVEWTDEGDFYTPNLWLGLLLMALLLGRLAYRYTVLAAEAPPPGSPADPLQAYRHHPLTLMILGLVLGYYLSYYGGVLWVHRRHLHRGDGRG